MEPGEGTSNPRSPGVHGRAAGRTHSGVCESRFPAPPRRVLTGGARTLVLSQGHTAPQGPPGNAQGHALLHSGEGRLVAVLLLVRQGQRRCSTPAHPRRPRPRDLLAHGAAVGEPRSVGVRGGVCVHVHM